MLATESGLFGLVRPAEAPSSSEPCDEHEPVGADEDFGWPLPGLAT
jgi:hypothetical protein